MLSFAHIAIALHQPHHPSTWMILCVAPVFNPLVAACGSVNTDRIGIDRGDRCHVSTPSLKARVPRFRPASYAPFPITG